MDFLGWDVCGWSMQCVVWVIQLKTPLQEHKINVNYNFRLLKYVTDYTTFTALCLLIRGIGALGSSAYSTASYVFVISTFPDNISSVIVSCVTCI